MPFDFRIDADLDLVVVKASGVLTSNLLYDCVTRYMKAPEFHPGIDVLFKLSEDIRVEIEGHEVPVVTLAKSEVLIELEALVKETRKGHAYKRACVGGSQKTQGFFAAGMGLVNDAGKYAAFDELPAALTWLGRPK